MGDGIDCKGAGGTFGGEDFFIMIVIVVTWLYVCQYSLNWTLKVGEFYFLYIMPQQRKNRKQTVYCLSSAVLGIWLDKCDTDPPLRELTVYRHGIERLTVQRDQSPREKYWGTKEGVLYRKGPTKKPWVSIWWVNRSQMSVEGKGIPGKDMQLWDYMLCFINYKEPGIAGALEPWDLCGSGKSWSWTGWQRDTRWNDFSYLLIKLILQKKRCTWDRNHPSWMRDEMVSFLFIPFLLS